MSEGDGLDAEANDDANKEIKHEARHVAPTEPTMKNNATPQAPPRELKDNFPRNN